MKVNIKYDQNMLNLCNQYITISKWPGNTRGQCIYRHSIDPVSMAYMPRLNDVVVSAYTCVHNGRPFNRCKQCNHGGILDLQLMVTHIYNSNLKCSKTPRPPKSVHGTEQYPQPHEQWMSPPTHDPVDGPHLKKDLLYLTVVIPCQD